MHKDATQFLWHILDECDYILSVITPELSKGEFLANATLKRAIVRSIEVIGEASKQISFEDRSRWPAVNWKNMTGMRDRLIHDYMGINYQIVWDVVKHKIPELHLQIRSLLSAE
ncbi:MAG: DUF86 domain-containing protein [Bacteroidetes bacterium]|nr:DUF86 domain-containing protein [Bacteroidota bacterium]MBU1719287.1 DUF86 domain-containing protein [Bacteroidota bacterium]